jgi:lipopolysaccharide transport system ATP-binding protein
MAPVIEVQGLSKTYTLRHAGRERYQTFRDMLAARAAGLLRFGGRRGVESEEEFRALDDVSFEVNAGDRLAIVGRNGAGKSTLLKVLSRITAPTAGRIAITGRVGSLLEVGTGFHPELTGRENIFLNGVILGMSREDVKRRFDEIVAFAEIEQFLDTPAKRYSSGMYVRLAFAVAAHLDADILLVDEVLAVGDIAFQRKCLSRMSTVGKDGRTVIFVSHNLEAVSKLCNRGILLGNGRIRRHGTVAEVLDQYSDEVRSATPASGPRGPETGAGGATIEAVWCSGADGGKIARIDKMEPLSMHLRARVDPVLQDGVDLTVAFAIDTLLGTRLFTCVSSWTERSYRTRGPVFSASCRLQFVPFVPGTYLISAAIMRPEVMLHLAEHCATIEVTDRREGYFAGRAADHGALDLPFTFEAGEP